MPFILPLISIALAILAHFAARDEKRSPLRWDIARLIALAVLVAVAYALSERYASKTEASAGLGLIIGAALVAAASALTNQISGLAIGVAAASSLHILAVTVQASAGIGLLCGAGLAALLLAGEAATTAAVAATVVVAADYLSSRHSPSPAAAYLGSIAVLCAVVGGIVGMWLGAKLAFLRGLLIGVLVLFGGLVATGSVSDHFLLTTIAIGAGAGVVIDWLIQDEEADGVRIGLAAIIGIGIATLSFGLARNAGIALSTAAAFAILLALGNRRAALTLGPLLGLTLFRVLSDAHPAASHALDIGQHYALLGLTLGAILPLLPIDWLKREGWQGAVGAALWGLLLLGIPPLVLMMFGDKGAIGFVVGVGFSGICQVLRKQSDLLPAAIASVAGAVTIFTMNGADALTELNRDQKMKSFELAALALVVIAAFLTFLSRAPKTTTPSES